jgi:hypothetical protein
MAAPADAAAALQASTVAPPSASDDAGALLRNGLRFSGAFAVNEGALLAVIALSAALVDPAVAALGNALLYLAFSLGCVASPAVVRALGLRRSLLLGTSAYTLYVAAYIVPTAATVPPAALLAGAAGAVLWTAQGAYFSRNGRLFARARSGDDASVDAEARAVTLFATLFAVLFPAVVAAFKAASSLLLVLTRGATPPVYAALALAALTSVAVMSGVMPLTEEPHDSSVHAAPAEDTPEAHAGLMPADATLSHSLLRRGVSAVGSSLRELAVAHRDATLLLMLPTNVAFGLCTAFFPYTVTILAKDALGAAAVGWLYAAANVVSALAAAAFGVAAQRVPGCRPAIFAVGAAAFAGAAGAVFSAGGAPTRGGLFALFSAYGIGIAVWQGTCMAFFGDAFPGRKALPAFAALKLHSGLASATAFFTLPSAPPRTAAAACVATALLGFATYLVAEMRVRAAAARQTAIVGGAVGTTELQRLL